uniref:UBP-type domain-containing protein n=1 Tax=Leptocylindrus danicus TaxID=163516 RepID=A0A7S2JWA5_9STRA|mmetsp:Transcript_11565/g.17490  ORF Transcript_11565/g.17490 Transcript_11565/m.17490 type:complete len:400 (+) Transcript_11565:135-1334(+)
MAYNYCLDHGGEDSGGHITPNQFCVHLHKHAHQHRAQPGLFPKDKVAMQRCSHSDCSGTETMENWLCLACHSILCSRYVKSHALHHYESSGHCVAVSLADLSVWCYACNSYIRHDSLAPVLRYLEAIKFEYGEEKDDDSDLLPMEVVGLKTGVAYQSQCSPTTNSSNNNTDSVADMAYTYAHDHESIPFTKCLAVSNLDTLMEFVCNGTLENGLALLDDARDPLCDVDAVAFTVDRALKSFEMHRVLVVNWGLYEGGGKRMCNEDDDLEALILAPLDEQNSNNDSHDGAARYISCSLNDEGTSSWDQVLSLARKWSPDLIMVRAGFSEGQTCKELSLETARKMICQSLGKTTMPSAAGKLIVVPCIGGRPTMDRVEAHIFARNSQVCLQALLALTLGES